MSDTNVVQTEGTNLAVVEETTFNAFTPPDTGWRNLQPNSYGSFGSSYKKTPRDPISKNLQLQKPMLTDQDSMMPFEHDITKDVIDRFGEGIFRSVAKHSGGTGQSLFAVTAVTATGFTVDDDGDLQARTLVYSRGMGDPGNDGLWLVGAGSTTTEIKVAGLSSVETSTPANASVEVAGFRFASGDLVFDADSNLTCSSASFLTMGLNEEQWVVVGGRTDDSGVYTFATEELTGAARLKTIAAHKLTLERRTWGVEEKAWLDLSGLATQLDTIVEARLAGAAGNSITVASVASGTPAAKAELDMNSAGNSVHIDTIIRAKLAGTDGNDITVEVVSGAPTAAGVLTEVGTHVKLAIKITATATTVGDLETLIGTSTLIEVKTAGTGATSLDATDVFDSAPLTGGTAATAASVTEVGDAVTLHFTSGATTLAELEAVIDADSTKIQVKTAGTQSNVLAVTDDDFAATNLDHGDEGSDDGAGKTVELYFSRWYRNVPIDHDDFKKPSYAFEFTTPELAEDGSDEYLYSLGNMLDECVWNFPLTGKATVNLSFVGCRTRNPTANRVDGPADALDANTNAGISTSIDLQRLRVAGVDELGILTDFTSLKVTDKNNISAQKQLGRLGAKRLNQGKHTSMVDAEALFTSSEMILAVRDNRDACLDILMRNEDFGALLDVQTMTLDSSDPKLEKDKIVSIGSKGTGFQNKLSTDSLSVFAYLPELPEEDQ